MNRQYFVGDIVKISRHSEYYSSNDSEDPRDTEGEVRLIAINDSHEIRVEWSNDTDNVYRPSDLRLVRRP